MIGLHKLLPLAMVLASTTPIIAQPLSSGQGQISVEAVGKRQVTHHNPTTTFPGEGTTKCYPKGLTPAGNLYDYVVIPIDAQDHNNYCGRHVTLSVSSLFGGAITSADAVIVDTYICGKAFNDCELKITQDLSYHLGSGSVTWTL